MVEHTMDVTDWLRKQLEDAHPDLLRAMVKEMAEALMSADADAVCGAGICPSPSRDSGWRAWCEGTALTTPCPATSTRSSCSALRRPGTGTRRFGVAASTPV